MLSARMDWPDTRVLDLYAGSGALGLEALSRGAASVLFVESNARAAEVIAGNIAALELGGATLRRGAVAAVLAAGTEYPVDLVLADPPYDAPGAEIEAIAAALASHGWATAGTVAVIERAASAPPVGWPPRWEAWRSRRYGQTRLELAELT